MTMRQPEKVLGNIIEWPLRLKVSHPATENTIKHATLTKKVQKTHNEKYSVAIFVLCMFDFSTKNKTSQFWDLDFRFQT